MRATAGRNRNMQAVGAFVRRARKQRGWTQGQLARLTRNRDWQLSRSTVSAIELGRHFPGMEALLALCEALGCSADELIARAGGETETPTDYTAWDDERLHATAYDRFWVGDFVAALAASDELAARARKGMSGRRGTVLFPLALIEVNRATVLRRMGALDRAADAACRAIGMSEHDPGLQASGYVALAGLHFQRGNVPLGVDAVRRASELSVRSGRLSIQGWVWNLQGKSFVLAGRFGDALQAYRESWHLSRRAEDVPHLTHAEGNIGHCWRGLGRLDEARRWTSLARDRARHQGQITLEANWSLALASMAEESRALDEARENAAVALRIGRQRGDWRTIYRAERLLSRVARLRSGSGSAPRGRAGYDPHQGPRREDSPRC